MNPLDTFFVPGALYRYGVVHGAGRVLPKPFLISYDKDAPGRKLREGCMVEGTMFVVVRNMAIDDPTNPLYSENMRWIDSQYDALNKAYEIRQFELLIGVPRVKEDAHFFGVGYAPLNASQDFDYVIGYMGMRPSEITGADSYFKRLV